MGMKSSRCWLQRCVLTAFCLGLSTTGASADVWNGAGVAGGTDNNAWLTDANWLDGTKPTASDDVTITLNTSSTPNPAVNIAAGAVAHNVTASGVTTTNNRIVQVTGNASFNTLSVSAIHKSFVIDPGAVLTLGGGSAAIKTLVNNDPGTVNTPTNIWGEGRIDLTSSTVFVNVPGAIGVTLNFTNPNAVIDFSNQAVRLAHHPVDTSTTAELRVYDTQTIQNLPALQLFGDAALKSADGDPLHNMSGVALILGDQANPTPTTAMFDGGTFRAIRALLHVTQVRTPTMTAQGDFTIVGQEAGNAIFVSRKNGGFGTTLHLNGFDMTVTSTAPVVIGDPVSAGTSDAPVSALNMIGSTVTVAGDFTVGRNGILRSDAGTILKLAGDFFINTAKNLTASEYNMTSATVVLNGDEKQRFEVHGIDNGTTPLANNFAIGNLVIGEGGSPTFVELTDLFDYGGGTPTAPTPNGLADALYLTSLTMNPGTILGLNYLNVYVNGVKLLPGAYQGGFVYIPEPGAGVLLWLGAWVMLRRKGWGA